MIFPLIRAPRIDRVNQKGVVGSHPGTGCIKAIGQQKRADDSAEPRQSVFNECLKMPRAIWQPKCRIEPRWSSIKANNVGTAPIMLKLHITLKRGCPVAFCWQILDPKANFKLESLIGIMIYKTEKIGNPLCLDPISYRCLKQLIYQLIYQW